MEQVYQYQDKEPKILRWGVSNFDIDDMEELCNCRNGDNCAVNQVLYHLGSRGIEFSLLPWMMEHNMPVMAYCPIAKGGSLRRELLKNQVVNDIAASHNASPIQILLAWVLRDSDIIAIPKAVQEEHVIENAKAASIVLAESDLAKLDSAFPKPHRKISLDIL